LQERPKVGLISSKSADFQGANIFFEPMGNLLSARSIQWLVRGSSSAEARTRKEKSCTIAIAAAVAAGLGFASAIAAPAAKPTDPQIVHIAYTADQFDIEAGKLALAKSKNADVRAFAQRMVGDQTIEPTFGPLFL
jgi:Domain of unknown function (DUF4142)